MGRVCSCFIKVRHRTGDVELGVAITASLGYIFNDSKIW